MRILLVTDIPPCENYTAGLVLNRLVRFLPKNDIVICAVVNPALSPIVPDDLMDIPTLSLEKPRENALRVLPYPAGAVTAFLFEIFQSIRIVKMLLPQIFNFARIHKVEAIWVVLQGQTMVRLAVPLARALRVPLFTQVWDPFRWWLCENRIDRWTSKRLLAKFDNAIHSSKSCATASWAMSETYTEKYRVNNVPVIAGLPSACAHPPAKRPHSDGEFIIAIAGQIYAKNQWDCLIQTLNTVNWIVAGRKIRVRVMGSKFSVNTQSPANFEYLGWQSQVDTIRLLSESDLLYMPYWFSADFKEESSNSFPSKLVSYFASGRPVFCHAPVYSSPAKYVARNNAGYMCCSMVFADVLSVLELAITDTKVYGDYSTNGSNCFTNDFTLERMNEAFTQFLTI
jgi:glycosyltransferase involved in cell wall biosynthesis